MMIILQELKQKYLNKDIELTEIANYISDNAGIKHIKEYLPSNKLIYKLSVNKGVGKYLVIKFRILDIKLLKVNITDIFIDEWFNLVHRNGELIATTKDK